MSHRARRAECACWLAERKAAGQTIAVLRRQTLGPVGSGHAQAMAGDSVAAKASVIAAPAAPGAAAAPRVAAPVERMDSSKPMTTLHQSFSVNYPRAEVWASSAGWAM